MSVYKLLFLVTTVGREQHKGTFAADFGRLALCKKKFSFPLLSSQNDAMVQCQ